MYKPVCEFQIRELSENFHLYRYNSSSRKLMLHILELGFLFYILHHRDSLLRQSSSYIYYRMFEEEAWYM